MKNNDKRNTDNPVKRPLKKDKTDKRFPNPDDPNEEMGMPNKEMPANSDPRH
jgi:hypothetical protein